MEQLVESLVLGDLSKEKIDRARKRGIAYECLWCFKEGKKTVNIKCRTEEHVVKTHLKKDQVAFNCLLCDFVSLKRDLFLAHVSNNAKHVMRAAKLKVLDHRPYLWENPSPYVLGADDYRAYSPEASLLHFLGVLNSAGIATETYPSTEVAPTVLGATELPIMQPVVSEAVGLSTVCTFGMESPVTTGPTLQTATQAMMSTLGSPTVMPPVADQPICKDLWRPYALTDPVEHPGLGGTSIADQLMALLENTVSGQQAHTPTFGPAQDPLPLEVLDRGESLEGGRIVDNNQTDGTEEKQGEAATKQSGAEDHKEGARVVTEAKEVREEAQVGERTESEGGEEGLGVERQESEGTQEGEIEEKADKEQSRKNDLNQEEDVLDLEDDNMSISSPVKRRRQEEVKEQREIKKLRENPTELSNNLRDLSERTLVETVESVQKVGKRSVVVSEDLIKAVIDNTCVIGKLMEAVNKLQKQLEEHERNDRRREERRLELEQRREEEWRRAFYRLRDEERRWDERRKEMERREREERREKDDRRKKEERKTEEKDKRKETKENQRPQSVLGRVYTKDTITDANRRS